MGGDVIDRAARAINPFAWYPECADPETYQHEAKRQARAVLEAIREPSSEMLEGFGIHKARMRQNWQAMIDAALA